MGYFQFLTNLLIRPRSVFDGTLGDFEKKDFARFSIFSCLIVGGLNAILDYGLSKPNDPRFVKNIVFSFAGPFLICIICAPIMFCLMVLFHRGVKKLSDDICITEKISLIFASYGIAVYGILLLELVKGVFLLRAPWAPLAWSFPFFYTMATVWPAHAISNSSVPPDKIKELGLKTAGVFAALWVGALILTTGSMEKFVNNVGEKVESTTSSDRNP